jgi:exopolysaccharide production protein ExoY
MSLDSTSVIFSFPDQSVDDFGNNILRSIQRPAFKFDFDYVWRPANQTNDALIRLFDIAVSLTAFLILLPFVGLLFLIVKISSPGPAIFVQYRIGRDGQPFPCLKFRTMVIDAAERLQQLLAESDVARAEWAEDQKLRSDPRITIIGGFLRKTSLDELPQLLNIALGHMSIVGPRPIVEAEIEKYGRNFADYCKVRPGLTGLWQISGRNDTGYAQRVAFDVHYVETRNLRLNMEICFKTVPALMFARGCY